MSGLSELLKLIRLNASIYHNALVCGNWCIEEKEIGATCFHMVTTGATRLEIPGHQDIELNVGDLVIFPQEIPHRMTPLAPLKGKQVHIPFSEVTDEIGTGMLCGEIRFAHRAAERVIKALPEVIVINNLSCSWISPITALIIDESINASDTTNIFLDKLSETLFIYALRHYIETEEGDASVLAIYAHPRLSVAIDHFHAAPDHPWTLEKLAETAALSRTQFAKVFKEVSGLTAMEYVTWWRMQIAWDKLVAGDTMADVAESVGYKSESSFLRAFKNTMGISAGTVRRSHAK
jgi:AraC-like DNA-binding protein